MLFDQHLNIMFDIKDISPIFVYNIKRYGNKKIKIIIYNRENFT